MADAWGLRFKGTNEFATLASSISASGVTDFVLEVDMIVEGSGTKTLFSSTSNNRPLFTFTPNETNNLDDFSIFRLDSSAVSAESDVIFNERFRWKLVLDATTFTIETPYGNRTPVARGSDNYTIRKIGENRNGFAAFEGVVYGIRVFKEGVLTNEWVNRTSGTASTWVDNIGGIVITLNNFPTDGSQWELYNDAFGLQFQNQTDQNNYVTIPAIVLDGDSDFKIDIVASTQNLAGTDSVLISQSLSDSFRYIGLESSQFSFRWLSVGLKQFPYPVGFDVSIVHKYTIEKVGSLWTVYFDDTPTGNFTDSSVGDQSWEVFGTANTASNNKLIESISFEVDGVLVREYKNKTGFEETVWEDRISGQDGTLVNFSTTFSPWVRYDDGTGGGGGTVQTLAPINAVQSNISAALNFNQNLKLASTFANQLNSSQVLNTEQTQKLATIFADQTSVSGSLLVSSLSALGLINLTQTNVVELLSLTETQFIAQVFANQLNVANVLQILTEVYYLYFDGVDDFVSFTNMQSSSNWDLSFSAWNTGTDEFLVLGSDFADFSNFIILRNTNEIEYRRNNQISRFAVNDVRDPNADYRFQMRAGTLTLFENNVAGDVRTVSLFDVYGQMNQFGRTNTTVREGALKYLRLTDIDTPANNRNYSNRVNNTSSTFPEILNNQFGTLNNFSSPPSWELEVEGIIQTLNTISTTQNNTAAFLAIKLLQNLILTDSVQTSSTELLSINELNAIELVNAIQNSSSLLLDIKEFSSLEFIDSVQFNSADLLNITQNQVLAGLVTAQVNEAIALNLEQSGFDIINLVNANQINNAALLSIKEQQVLAELVAQQVSRVELIGIERLQAISFIASAQNNNTAAVNIESLQKLSLTAATQINESQTLNLEQFSGQVVTLISAQQANGAETLLISTSSSTGGINVEQITTALLVELFSKSDISVLNAEQISTSGLLYIIANGDLTDLTGLTLTRLTNIYTIETNPNIYTLEQ